MRDLYLTHEPLELVMALIQLQCGLGCLCGSWWCWNEPGFGGVPAFIAAELSLICLALCWAFLFTMPGSRERRCAAEPAKAEAA